jgi:hypothetical protein
VEQQLAVVVEIVEVPLVCFEVQVTSQCMQWGKVVEYNKCSTYYMPETQLQYQMERRINEEDL